VRDTYGVETVEGAEDMGRIAGLAHPNLSPIYDYGQQEASSTSSPAMSERSP